MFGNCIYLNLEYDKRLRETIEVENPLLDSIYRSAYQDGSTYS